jgi:hypothetical protein
MYTVRDRSNAKFGQERPEVVKVEFASGRQIALLVGDNSGEEQLWQGPYRLGLSAHLDD